MVVMMVMMLLLYRVNTWVLGLLELQPEGLAKANQGVWERNTKGGTRLYVFFHSENFCPVLSSLLYTLFCLFLTDFLFLSLLENLWQKNGSSPFLGTQISFENLELCRKMSINSKTLQKFRDPQILWNPCRSSVKIPSKCSPVTLKRKRKGLQSYRRHKLNLKGILFMIHSLNRVVSSQVSGCQHARCCFTYIIS